MEDTRNVIDKYKGWTVDLIREDIKSKKFPFAVAMQHINSDFNLSCVFRSANMFGANEVFYIGGKRHYDKRGCVGVNHYSSIQYIKTIEELKVLKNKYVFVGLENNIQKSCQNLNNYKWKQNSLILIGEEQGGLVPEIIELCDEFVEIPNFGSVRSLNAASAASIAMYDYTAKYGG